MQKNLKNELHICEFCKREFHKELTLINHSCEKKRRWFVRDDTEARLAFMAWSRFYELNSQLKKQGTKRTHREFIDSRYYIAFIKFAKQVIDLNAISPDKFVDYVIKNNLPLDKWTHDAVYEKYVDETIKTESPEDALARTIELMKQWSEQTGNEWFDFFRHVNTNQAAAWVKNGKISPWVLYNADSADDLLTRCNQEQISIIAKMAKPAPWKVKFNRDKDSADWIRDTLRKAGV
jgi:hypothetical protein